MDTEHIRALVVVFALSTLAFVVSRAPFRTLVGNERVRVWIAVLCTLTADLFLSGNFWLFLLVAGLILSYAVRFEHDRVVLYNLIISAVPALTAVMPGFAGIESLVHITPQDFFAVVLLVPALLHQRETNHVTDYGRWPFVFLTAYFFLIICLSLRDSSVTSTLRFTIHSFLAMMIPFTAFSICVNSFKKMKYATAGFIFPLLPLACISVFELLKSWHLYFAAVKSLTEVSSFRYLMREGAERAYGSTGQPIIFGFLFMVGIGFCLGFPKRLLVNRQRILLLTLLTIGLLPPLSRGPWMGTLVIFVVFIVTGSNPVRNLLKLCMVCSAIFVMAALLLGSEKLLSFLPFVSDGVMAGTVDYRFQLFENAWALIVRNPLFGMAGSALLQTPEMQEMIQGEGIVDIVNTYLVVALESGFVGLGLYILFFISTLFGLLRAFWSLPESESDHRRMARALFATLCGALVAISTVSPVGQIPYLCWMLAGLCVAQTRIIRTHMTTLDSTVKSAQSFAMPTRAKPTNRHHFGIDRWPAIANSRIYRG